MKTFVTLAVAAVALAASPAAAHTVQISEDGRYRISIPYGDLNLGSQAGARTLEGRLKVAANTVCGTRRPSSLLEARELEACRDNVIEIARPQMTLALDRGADGNIALAASR